MKKLKNPNKIDCIPIQNPVAKFAHQFNKAHVFVDKSKYRRNAKHRKQEASPIALIRAIREASCALDIAIHNLVDWKSAKIERQLKRFPAKNIPSLLVFLSIFFVVKWLHSLRLENE